jgi:hypothetical protein
MFIAEELLMKGLNMIVIEEIPKQEIIELKLKTPSSKLAWGLG